MEGAKRARRRRIVERGSDRLAFITGQIQSLPASSSSSSPPLDPLPDQSNAAPTSHDKDEVDSSVLPKCEATDETVRNTYEASSRTEPFQKSETSNEPTVKALDCGSKVEPSTSSTIQNSSVTVDNPEPPCVVNPRPNHPNIFTAKRLISSITASENIRLLCSAIISLLVVLSHHRYLIGSNIVRSIMLFRPVFLVLLTDITIVLGLLLVSQGSYGKAEKEARRTNTDEYGWTQRVEKALEVGLVLQKAIPAVVMDCSVYAVILICGLSLMQYWSTE